jgi:hypothetical protein
LAGTKKNSGAVGKIGVSAWMDYFSRSEGRTPGLGESFTEQFAMERIC